MTDQQVTRRRTRRDTLKIGSAVGIAVATGAALARSAATQEATPAPDGISRSVQTLSLDAAVQLIEVAEQASAEIGVPMAIAIVDHAGLLKAYHRMDGLDRAVADDIVVAKAYTSTSFQAPTHVLAESAADSPAFLASVTNIPGFTLLGGGYPITDGEVVVGGIGVGGGSEEQDMEVAEAALAALGR